MILLATESTAIRPDIEPLLVRHYEEIALYKDTTPLAPDWGRYEYMEQNNALRVYTARLEGELVGYSVFLLTFHLHYVDTLFANNDVLYITPEFRRGTTGQRLMVYSERQLKESGVSRVLWHIKTGHDWSPILERMGYAKEEIIMGKRI